jgi:hypothetical protein
MMRQVYLRILKRILYGYTTEEVPIEVHKQIENERWKRKVLNPNYHMPWKICLAFLKIAFLIFIINLYMTGLISLDTIFWYSIKAALFFFVGFLVFMLALNVVRSNE